MKKIFFVLAAAIIGSHSTAQDSISSKQLDEVVVTATKYPVKQSATGKVVTIINRAALERNSGSTLSEILNNSAGISVNGANNTLGSVQTLNIRGASAGNALVLMDGVPINDPSVIYNYFDLNLLPLDQIERIEILKGGQSTLYGSDAVAGVVNIITRKNNLKKFGAAAGFSGGSYGTLNTHAAISGKASILQYQLQYSGTRADGFSSAYDAKGDNHFDNDGYRQHTFNGNIGFKINDQLTATLFGQYSKYHTDLDAGAFTDEKDFTSTSENKQWGTGLVYKWKETSFHFNYQYNKVTRTYLNDSVYRSDPTYYYSRGNYKGYSHYAEIYGNHHWKQVEIIAGLDYRYNKTNQDYFSISSYGPFTTHLGDSLAHMKQLSPYASLLVKANEKFSIEIGGRWNHHSVYGDNFTYTVNPFYNITKEIKIFTNLYSAYKTPSLYQLFDPFSGNKSLQPEKSTIAEAGIAAAFPHAFQLRMVYFYGNTRHAIQYVTVDPVNYISSYQNISQQKNYGLELELSKKTGPWNFAANYTYTDGKTSSPYDASGNKLSADTSYNNLYRIPRNAFNLDIALQATKQLLLSTHLHAVGKRWEPVYGAPPMALAAYYTLDLSGNYKITKALKIFLQLKNISNQQYFDILGYNCRRFNCMAGASFNL